MRKALMNSECGGEEVKKTIEKVLIPEYLSSEESDQDEEGRFFRVRRLSWQGEKFRRLKDSLEERHQDQLSPAHRHQIRRRVVLHVPSKRTMPRDCPKFVYED